MTELELGETATGEPHGGGKQLPPPVVAARGLGLRTSRGWVFRDVTVVVRPGELVSITGPAGSGRTSLLLALSGRFATNRGTLDVPRRARTALALGYVPGVHEPEPALTIAEHFTERRLLLAPLGNPFRRVRATPDAVRDPLPGPVHIGLPTERTLARDLSPYQRQLLCLQLALTAGPQLVAVDDVDSGLTLDEQATLWSVLLGIAASGVAVIATCREATAFADRTVTLTKG